MKCHDCEKELGGGFPAKEIENAYRCCDCMIKDMDKAKGWWALDQIFDVLTTIPKLDGRKYKDYSKQLKEQRSIIANIVCIYRAQQPEYLKKE